MTTKIIRDNKTWGKVIAVEVDGKRITKPDDPNKRGTRRVEIEVNIHQDWLDAVADLEAGALDEIPMPANVQFARDRQAAAGQLQAIIKMWADDGIEITREGVTHTLRATELDATQYLAEIQVATMGQKNPVLSSLDGKLIEVPLAEVGEWIGQYHQLLTARRKAGVAAAAEIESATTKAELDAAIAALREVI